MTDFQIPKITTRWNEVLRHLFISPEYQDFRSELSKKYETSKVCPSNKKLIYAALKETDFDKVNVVILGQDPYHGPNQATGVAFGVESSLPRPPTLRNILKEVSADIKTRINPGTSTLVGWAKQGVLLLNTALTTDEGRPGSHTKMWEPVTDEIIRAISEKRDSVVFLLWGEKAKEKSALIDYKKHAILEAAHPSPHSVAGFYGCSHFSKANELLRKFNKPEIDWSRIDAE